MNRKLLLLITALTLLPTWSVNAVVTTTKACDATSPTVFKEVLPLPATNTISANGYKINYGRTLYTPIPTEVIGSTSNCVTITNGYAVEAFVYGSPSHAPGIVTIERTDHKPFDLNEVLFDAQFNVLTGGLSIEIMPVKANGNDGLVNPYIFDLPPYQPAGVNVVLPAYAGVGFSQYKLSGFFTGVKSFTATDASLAPSISTSALPNGVIGVAYSTAIVTSSPNADPSTVTVSGLPAGLSFDGSNIIGIPTTVETQNALITVTDNITLLSTSRAVPLTVNDAPISFTSSLPNGVTGTAYSSVIGTATGGTGVFSYSTASVLPAGLTLTGNTLSGTPTLAGIWAIAFDATDSAGNVSQAVANITIVDPAAGPIACSGTSNIVNKFKFWMDLGNGAKVTYATAATTTTVAPAIQGQFLPGEIVTYNGTLDPASTLCNASSLTVNPKVALTTTSLQPGIVGAAYSTPITVQYGSVPYLIDVAVIPAGLSFNGANLIGTPTVAGTFPLSITAIDAYGVIVTQNVTLTIAAPVFGISTPALSSGVVGKAYSVALTASNGVAPLKWSASNLPADLKITTAGLIYGKPTLAGYFSPVFSVTDANGSSTSTTLSMGIDIIAISTASLKSATINKSYLQALVAKGGVAPYKWTLTGGSLPAGLSLSTAGKITGKPTVSSTFALTFTVTDANGASANHTFSLSVL